MIIFDGIKNFFTGIAKKIQDGDRVIWMVLILLLLISTVAIFSSTSLLAIKQDVSRFVIFRQHLWAVFGGLVIIFLCMLFWAGFFKWCSQWGFALSLLLLLLLVCNVRIGKYVYVPDINEASRAIKVWKISVHVYEVVKVAMVMYLSWAIEAYEKNKFFIVGRIAKKWPKTMGWIASDAAKRWIYIFIPVLCIPPLILVGSAGSAALVFIVMLVTLLVGGLKWSDLFKIAAVGASCVLIVLGIHLATNGKVFSRIETASHRAHIALPYFSEEKRAKQKLELEKKEIDINKLKRDSQEWYDYIDDIKQPKSAELAWIQGGRRIIGKLPGKSTQKYVVSVMFEDYMFSFIMEEYGLVGGLLVILLYMSLFARGMILVHHCGTRFTQACIGGLVFLITFQAFFHITVNCAGLVTGQTLPLISHGRGSLLCFCLAFGVILSLSEKVYNKVRTQQKEEVARMAVDEVQEGVTMTEDIDSEENLGQNIEELIGNESNN